VRIRVGLGDAHRLAALLVLERRVAAHRQQVVDRVLERQLSGNV
jgi:hypothetical protein